MGGVRDGHVIDHDLSGGETFTPPDRVSTSGMDLSPETVARLAAEYPDLQPLAAVESEHLEVLPATFASGDYGWRDAEWVVQWYFRRFLGAYPDADRRASEAAFGENGYEDVHAAISGAHEAESTTAKLDRLDELTGVDVSVASAFLQFLEPAAYVVMSPVEWEVLRDAGAIEDPYPDEPTADDYRRYLESCVTIADGSASDGFDVDGSASDGTASDGTASDGSAFDGSASDGSDVDLWTVYRALWVRWHRESGEIPSAGPR